MRRHRYATAHVSRWRTALLIFAVVATTASAEPPAIDLSKGIVFYAGFDDVTDANLSTDAGFIYTADTLERKSVRKGNHRNNVTIVKGVGRFGDALRFKDVSKQVLLYKGVNVGYRRKDWSGTVAFWLKLSPDSDLKAGFCDPIQITDKKWNDAAMWVDFDKELPRDFRLGVFPDYRSWNPDDVPYAKVPSEKRPWIPVQKPPFSREKWTHVAWTFEHVNADEDAVVVLYLDGKSQGTVRRPLRFTWDPEKAAILLGINYIGDFDDLVIYDRPLNVAEIRQLGRQSAAAGLSSE